MKILGLACFDHDSAACVVCDGRIVAAAREERFNHHRGTTELPLNAINHCVQDAGLSLLDLDQVAFYEKPYLRFHREVLSHLRTWPFSFGSFLRSMPPWLRDRLVLPMVLKNELGFEGQVLFFKHHLSHAASAFLPSPHEQAAIITCDGVGEWASMSYGVGRGQKIEIQKELLFPSSLGLLQQAVADFLGYGADGRDAVVALAARGEAERFEPQFACLLRTAGDGSFRLDPSYLRLVGARRYSRRFVKLFGAPRVPDGELQQRHLDLAAALQQATEQILLGAARHVHQVTGMEALCVAGSGFLNCATNMQILRRSPFSQLFIQPAAGDAGGALGAALLAATMNQQRLYPQIDTYLGPQFFAEETRTAVVNSGMPHRQLQGGELVMEAARRVQQGELLGWFQGRQEFCHRGLGHRAILAHAHDVEQIQRVNRLLRREPRSPLACLVIEQRAAEFFDLDHPSPHGLLAPSVRQAARDRVPAVIHADGTARVQTINPEQDPLLHQLLDQLQTRGCAPVLLQSSLAPPGEPLVNSPGEALEALDELGLDRLIVGEFVVSRATAPAPPD